MSAKKFILAAGIVCILSSAAFADEVLFANGKAENAKFSRKIVPSPDNPKNKVLDFTVAAKGGGISATLTNHDWSKFKTLELKFFSKEKTDAKLMIILDSQPKDLDRKKSWSYLSKQINIKGQGWITVNVDLAKMGKARKAVGLKQIDKFSISSKGWNIKPVKTTMLYIGEIKLISK